MHLVSAHENHVAILVTREQLPDLENVRSSSQHKEQEEWAGVEVDEGLA